MGWEDRSPKRFTRGPWKALPDGRERAPGAGRKLGRWPVQWPDGGRGSAPDEGRTAGPDE
ncbi:putative hypothetical protein [Streptomyces sp. NBRC 110611]|nr:putative hypothetical protein [Streptomyces sp. NBRC 110611]